MSWPERLWPWRRSRRDQELDDEIRAHFAMAVRDRLERGEDPREAEYAVRREFGNVALVREVTRQMWGWNMIEQLGQDLRYAARSLRGSPGFTLAALLSLALGIGANTASFSISEALLLRPLPIEKPGEVVRILGRNPRTGYEEISYPDFQDLRAGARSFTAMTAFATRRLAVARDVDTVPRMVFGMIVSDGFFETIGVQPALGRAFTAAETTIPGRDPVAVISHEFWRDSLGADPRAPGAALRVNGIRFTIVGVTPENFTGMSNMMRYAVYVPATMADLLSPRPGGASLLRNRGEAGFDVRARLKPGTGIEQASAEIAGLGAALARAYPDTNKDRAHSALSDFQDRLRSSPQLLALAGMLMALSLLVLLIACANVASLLLARARVRAREMAIRTAIGAGRGRLFRQLLTESLALAFCGGALGIAAAYAAIRYLAAIRLPTDTPLALTTQLDGRVLLFSLLASLASAAFFGVAPALQTVKLNVNPTLKAGEAMVGKRSRRTGRSLLVGAQLALCLVLLVASAAMLDAFGKMLVLDPGIRTEGIMMMEFDPVMARYSQSQSVEFYRQLTERVRALPGVRSAAVSRAMPFRPNFNAVEVAPQGYVFPPGQNTIRLEANVVDADYFVTAGAALVRGRQFTREDRAHTAPVVIVNEEFERRYFPRQDALGKRVRLGAAGPFAEVVGVAKTARYLSLVEPPTPYLYLPFEQAPMARMTLMVASRGEPRDITGALFDTVRSLDPNMPVFNVYDMRTYYQQGVVAPARMVLQMTGATGVVGLSLAIVGLYGLVAYTVSRRTREIGIRLAVGADRRRILRLVLRQGLLLGAGGTLAGLLLSVPVFRLLGSALSGLGALNPWILAAAPAGLIVLTLLASYAPALKASRIDPVAALRGE